MKVLCIDASNQIEEGMVEEGLVYTASKCPVYPDCYDLAEIPNGSDGIPISYKSWRFIPLSNIDERELVKEREENMVTL